MGVIPLPETALVPPTALLTAPARVLKYPPHYPFLVFVRRVWFADMPLLNDPLQGIGADAPVGVEVDYHGAGSQGQ